jgi:hypothetical protein
MLPRASLFFQLRPQLRKLNGLMLPRASLFFQLRLQQRLRLNGLSGLQCQPQSRRLPRKLNGLMLLRASLCHQQVCRSGASSPWPLPPLPPLLVGSHGRLRRKSAPPQFRAVDGNQSPQSSLPPSQFRLQANPVDGWRSQCQPAAAPRHLAAR